MINAIYACAKQMPYLMRPMCGSNSIDRELVTVRQSHSHRERESEFQSVTDQLRVLKLQFWVRVILFNAKYEVTLLKCSSRLWVVFVCWSGDAVQGGAYQHWSNCYWAKVI